MCQHLTIAGVTAATAECQALVTVQRKEEFYVHVDFFILKPYEFVSYENFMDSLGVMSLGKR